MTTLTPLQQSVCLALAQGYSITAAARETGINRSTVYAWMKQDANFQHAVEKLRQDQSAEFYERLSQISSASLDLIEDTLHDPKTPISVRIRIAFLCLRTRDSQWTPLPAVEALLRYAASKSSTAVAETPAAPAPEAEPVPVTAPEPQAERQDIAIDLQHNPTLSSARTPAVSPRNAPCSCGSGLKFKRCCGKAGALHAVA